MTTLPPQPPDEWEFLSTDDEPPGEVDLDHDLPRAAEVAAMHIEAAEPRTRYSDKTTAPDDRDAAPVAYFDDEEPEQPGAVTRRADDGPVPDLEEILESQHYAFSPEREDVP